MSNTLKLGNGKWATGKDTLLSFSDTNNNYKPLPFSFSRDSSGTVINKDGLIETVGTGEPRIDFKDNTKGALLLEPSRSNLVTYSQDFSSGWSLDDATVSINSGISPDGTLNATLLKGNTNSSRHNLVISAQANNTGTFSIFVKAKELKYVQIASANTTEQYVNFDLINGVIGTVGSSFSNAKIEDYGNGWYRCIVVSANQFNGFYFSLVNGLNATWLESWVMPNSTDGLYIWGAQLEQGSYATSYIPTSGSAVTRIADACNNGANEQVINSTEGVFYFEGSALADDGTNRFLSLNDGTTNNYIYFRYVSTSNQYLFRTQVGGVTVNTLSGFLSDTTQNHKFAFKFKSGDYAMWVDGVEISIDTSSTIFPSNTLSNLEYSFPTDGGGGFQSNTRDLRVYDTALTDQELAALTS